MEKLLEFEIQYTRETYPPFGSLVYVPVVDGDVFPDSPSKLLREQRFVKGIHACDLVKHPTI